MSRQVQEVSKNLQAAAREAYKAGLYLQAADFFRKASEAAARSGNERERAYSLLWEGGSRLQAGEHDLALPLFLEVASLASPEVDPADTFNARTGALEISLVHKPVTLFRKLLGEGWLFLQRLGREHWGHKLLHLESQLEVLQGDYQGAFRTSARAWALDTDNYPGYTRATYIRQLCRTCFLCHDQEGLAQWVEAIETNRSTVEADQIAALEARLFSLRVGGCCLQKVWEIAEVARSILRRIAAMEVREVQYHLTSLRGLALAGCFSEVDGHLLRGLVVREKGERFGLHLFRGDLALCRARAELGAETRDDEWDLDYPLPQPPFPSSEAGRRFLAEAEGHFEAALPVAAEEDERLETQHHTCTLAGRLDRVRALRQAVEANE